MLTFDHIAVSGQTLAEATTYVAERLGLGLQVGGEHAVFHTHNTLLGLEDGLYAEAIAINPKAPKPDRPRWFDLDRFSGPARLTNWICRTDDIDAVVARMPDGAGKPGALQRGALKWRMVVPDDGILPFDNFWPAVIQWDVDLHPAQSLEPSGVRMQSFKLPHPDAGALSAALAPLIADDRIEIVEGDAPSLSAAFETPGGIRSL